ncbi:MAG: DUF58 domain-containing protein [Candidatus Latescibacteria bacterium]|nr:DUF58 domain-containing protein [Candidatus Latescibacterota bacterium]NIM22647.1 DUF58 domain-containing protein [Candidatus Latescibacterota bacterium]NIM64936.1 DUF58 domain-containing protein [Candidatus Latescibacterota bacterium]NIO01451.1 DUF58 domain-containing protein [Candidatus Latescibacterota bacterium]NIO27961.1 DUF58 domain-containing protein [Candidatus Latescibacterota bacterium]
MELKARLIVEGYIAGLHRSPYHGFSVEFAEYRQYMQGDSIRDFDWKAYGKTDRFYIKVYEEETNLRATILLDKSGSMGFSSPASRGGGGMPEIDKLTYGSLLSASLSYLMVRQQDAVGLCLFDDKIRTLIPHRSVRKHLFYLLTNLDRLTPGEKTRISPALHDIAERVTRRGLVILISDLMDDPAEVLMGLKHFRHRNHEVIVFHVLDRQELDLEYRDEVEFRDLETGKKIRVEPAFIKEHYSKQVGDWIDKLNRGCRAHQIDYNLLMTDTPFDQALTAYLGKRQRMT